MLFPSDPDKRRELWSSFEAKVSTGSVSFIVHSGEGVADEGRKTPVVASTDEVVSSFRAADVVRFGASRDSAIGPFFAFDLNAGCAKLVEYAIDPRTQSATDEAIQEALQSVAISLFFERRDISRILLPIVLSKWDVTEWDAARQGGSTELRRRAA
jgi:hypothetical protein